MTNPALPASRAHPSPIEVSATLSEFGPTLRRSHAGQTAEHVGAPPEQSEALRLRVAELLAELAVDAPRG